MLAQLPVHAIYYYRVRQPSAGRFCRISNLARAEEKLQIPRFVWIRTTKPPKLMDRVKATMRVKRYSPRTEKTYCYWIRYFIRLHGVRHPASL